MTLTRKPRKPKACRVCSEQFVPRRLAQVVCSVPCAADYARQRRESMEDRERRRLQKLERREIRAKKEEMKPRRKVVREAQIAFNRYIRLRDAGKPCISCGRNDGQVAAQAVGGTWDAGHYRTVGANPELRFELLNAHRQCKQCNRDHSGRVADYRINLIERIGLEAVEWLEGPHEPKRYRIDELRALAAEYRAKARELERATTENFRSEASV